MMRVTNSYMYDSFISDLQNNMQQLDKINQKISTGLDVNKPSDSPDKIGSIISLRDSIKNIAQYQTNVGTTNDYLNSTSTALTSMTNILNTAQTLAVQGANATYSATDRTTMATQVDNQIQEMLSLGNTQVNGQYIFGGFQTKNQPFSAVMTGTSVTGVTYNGDSGLMPEEINQGDVINKNVPGSSLTAAGTDVFNSLITFRNDLQNNDTTAITADINTLQNAYKSLTVMNTDIGGKLQRTADVSSTLTNVNTTLTGMQSKLEDVDMPTAMTNFQLQQNVYQSALTSISQLMKQTTLADILR
jgi:flagellar hook-associated protein 3 FlgL